MFELETLQHAEKHGNHRPKKETMVLAHFNPKEIHAMNSAQGEILKDAHGIPQFKNLWEHVLSHPQMQQNFRDHHEATKGDFHESSSMLDRLKSHGRHGDTMLASIPTGMAELLDSVYGRSRNPKDGKNEYFNASSIGNFLKGAVENIPFRSLKELGKNTIKTGAKAINYLRRPGAVQFGDGARAPVMPEPPVAAPLGRMAQMGRSAGTAAGKFLGSAAGAGLLGYAGSELGAHLGNQYGGARAGYLGRLAGAGLGAGLGGTAGAMLGKHYGGKYGGDLGGKAGEAVGSAVGNAGAAVGRAAAAAPAAIGRAVTGAPRAVADSAATAYQGLPEPVRNIAGSVAAEIPRVGSAALDALNAPANAFAAMHGPALSQDEYRYRMFPQLRPQPQQHPILDDVD